ncbi:hypothetical protein ACVW0P_004470 [Mucilaginibacter sp. UYNi724]
MENKNFELTINGKLFKSDKQLINGEELLGLLGIHHSADYEMLMKLTDREYEPIELKEEVDLKKPGIEAFLVKPYRSIAIEVDDEKYPVTEVLMTPKEIMVLAGLDANKHYLKQIIGHTDITYKNDPDHIIGIVDCMKFSSCKITSTTVS